VDWLTCQMFTWFWFNSSCVHLSLCQVGHKFIYVNYRLVDLSSVTWFWFNSSCVHLSLCQVVYKFIVYRLVDLSSVYLVTDQFFLCYLVRVFNCWRVRLFICYVFTWSLGRMVNCLISYEWKFVVWLTCQMFTWVLVHLF